MSGPVKMVLVGAGFVGRLHLLAAKGLDDVRYIAAVDTDATALAHCSREFGVAGYPTLAEALRAHEAEAVDLCVPTHLHRPLIEEAARLGLHVLCEKPLALTLEDAGAIVEAIERSRVRLMVAEVIRFWPEFVAAVDLIKSNELGAPARIQLQRLATSPPYNGWMVREELGGGAVIDLQVHDFSFLLQVLGPPRSIAPMAAGRSTINDVSNVLEYENGLTVTNRASFSMPPSYVFRSTFLIEFEDGAADMDDWRAAGEQLLIFPRGGARSAPAVVPSNPFRDEIGYFCRQLLAARAFDRVPLEQSIMALRMCLASREALRRGASVPVNPL